MFIILYEQYYNKYFQFTLPDIKGFLQRRHIIKKKLIKVEVSVYDPLQDENTSYQQDKNSMLMLQPHNTIPDTCTIEVTGYVSNTDALEVYFQGVHSGGKRVKTVVSVEKKNENIVCVKFASPEGKL